MKHGQKHSKNMNVARFLAVLMAGLLSVALVFLMAPSSAIADPLPDPAIGAVGDTACDESDPRYNNGDGTANACAQKRTSDRMLADTSLTTILGLGDYQYDCGAPEDWLASYDPTWGRLDAMMQPVVGNHEYKTGTDVFGAPCPISNSTAAGYFQHFGASAHAPNGYYSFNIGTWHLIALNANCGNKTSGGCAATSKQTVWLTSDLAATTQQCVLAYWHQPRYTGLAVNGGTIATYKPWWDALYAAHVDVVLNGHIHNYQRFPALDPNGVADATNGITEYIVGTGGEEQVAVKAAARPQPVFWKNSFGYLRMNLAPLGWSASFVDYTGAVLDTSVGTCHG